MAREVPNRRSAISAITNIQVLKFVHIATSQDMTSNIREKKSGDTGTKKIDRGLIGLPFLQSEIQESLPTR